jgi:hypothetical protein
MNHSKRCNACQQVKSASEFHVHKASPDGLRYQCKDCRKIERKTTYEANKHRELAKSKEYRDAHPEYTLQRAKEYYENNREKVLVRQSAYNSANRPKINDYLKSWRKKNPELARKHVRIRDRRMRAAKLGNSWEPYTEIQVLNLYGNTCHLCKEPIDFEAPRQVGVEGWEKGLHIDHLLPISKGGPDMLENVRPAHGLCNLKKNGRVAP